MSTDIESKKKHRKALRGTFTKIANETDALLKVKEPVHADIEISWELLRSKFEEMEICHKEVYEGLLDDASEDQLVAEMECNDAYTKRFTELRLKCEKILVPKLATCEDESSSESGNSSRRGVSRRNVAGKRKFKLPQIQFKTYDGNIRDWLPFWSQFKKIDEDSDIDKSDKIEYLLQATVPGSRARQLVESFPIVGENYDKIISCMQARFGREDLQIEVYVRELLKLILSNAMAQQKLNISVLYDRIETQLRALESLGITSEKYAAMLFPLIESCLPSDILRVWQRSAFSVLPDTNNVGSTHSLTGDITLEEKLKNLMRFLQSETENEQRIDLASEGFGLIENLNKDKSKLNHENYRKRDSKSNSHSSITAAGLINSTEFSRCIFCVGSHASESCFKAQKMDLEERKNLAANKKACFRCLKVGHQARKCRGNLKCIVCGKPHVVLMCSSLKKESTASHSKDNENCENSLVNSIVMSNNTNTHVFLQTLSVTVKGRKGNRVVRALIDTGSQRSYILKSVASKLDLVPIRVEQLVHCLFGGKETVECHYCYNVTVLRGNDVFTFEVLDQSYICNNVSAVFYGPWIKELQDLKVDISDTNSQKPIELLLGADVAGILYTGGVHRLQCGLVAIETFLGWTVMGKVSAEYSKEDSSFTILSLLAHSSISDLWQLDVLGIRDPEEKKSINERALAAKKLFIETVTLNNEGRYEVRLPWVEGHPPLPTNYNIAKRRLISTMQKLEKENLFNSYAEVFKEWESLGIIEQVEGDFKNGHFLPHRPVLKEGSTTAIRPVFDASAHESDSPSLNQCLEKGLNLIELIPTLYIRFRKYKYGVVSDIRKAFLQISLNEKDRDFLKFLWFDNNRQIIVLRHKRVVFGVNCSPFLLEATIQHHLFNCLKNCSLSDCKYSRETVELLSKSFYVDNCVTSLPDLENLHKFISESVQIMADGQFDLRGWEYTNGSDCDSYSVPVLGLRWFPRKDVIVINQNLLDDQFREEVVTKRRLLSAAQKVFDPIGFTSPTTLIPKLLLQRLWEKQISWDDPVDDQIVQSFKCWLDDLPYLLKIEIPRHINLNESIKQDVSIHTFCDASQNAYSAVVFCRVVEDSKVSVHLLAAKSRVAPLKKLTIPRLELLGATIGARLYSEVIHGLGNNYNSMFWSDSSTVISWIKRNEEWGTFVWNRVKEIRSLTPATQWRHIPGSYNPADLPSRGCSPKYLLESKWWEGPAWLYEDTQKWPHLEPIFDEEEILKERKKRLVATLITVDKQDFWHLSYFSKFSKCVRMIGWILRCVFNMRNGTRKLSGDLTVQELRDAENFVFKWIQATTFSGIVDEKIKNLSPFYDSAGIIRLKSKVCYREDTDDYRMPIILPGKNDIIQKLIMQEHQKLCHVGIQGLLCHLREKYWILGGRRIIRTILMRCVICKRYNLKPLAIESPPLPKDRVRDAVAFEICGVDFAGPLYLKSNEKAWVCLFTCAVYRAVHMELTVSLSTSNFLQVFRRFVARRGRPKILYSDNGTNFRGAYNALKKLDWEQITRRSSIEHITWRFNPPSAPWWGGFYERLIGIVKQLLRKILGRACLCYEELYTLICDCESVVNNRPLTYISNDSQDLVTLTPTMFLRDQFVNDVPDLDQIDKTSFSRSLRKKQKLRNDLRQRFRLEYLGQLKFANKKGSGEILKIGDVVLVENDSIKRVEWPLGRIVEVVPSKDGHIRLVRVKTGRGELLRPLQRILLLECGTDAPEQQKEEENQMEITSQSASSCNQENAEKVEDSAGVLLKSRVTVQNEKITRSGRVSKIPVRFS